MAIKTSARDILKRKTARATGNVVANGIGAMKTATPKKTARATGNVVANGIGAMKTATPKKTARATQKAKTASVGRIAATRKERY